MSVQGRPSVGPEPVVIRFAGELDASDSGLADQLLAMMDQGGDLLIVDMLNVTFVDSSVIRALVLAHRRASGTGGWVRVVYTHHVVRRVIDMCGLAGVFPQYPTPEAARRDMPIQPPDSETVDGRRGQEP